MTRIKQFALILAGACMLASCGSSMSEEEIATKANEKFEAEKANLDAAANQLCQETLDAQVALKADALFTERTAVVDTTAVAAPAK